MIRLQSRPIITACVVWLVALAAVLNASTTLRPVPYRDVKSIVLDAGKQTLGRRSTVPQMAYVGGDGRYAPFLPTTMQCTNTGWSGDQFTWACQAQLPPGVELDRVEVACEDWDPPVNDPTESDTMTAGSCGVEYTLRGTPPSPTPPPPVIQHVVHQTSPGPTHVQHLVYNVPSPAPPPTTTTVHHYGSPWASEEVKTILSFGAAALLIMLVVVCCMACDSQSSRSSAPAPQPQPAPPVVVIDEPAPLVVETADGDTAYARPLRRSQRRVVVEQAAPTPPPVYVAPAPAPVHYATAGVRGPSPRVRGIGARHGRDRQPAQHQCRAQRRIHRRHDHRIAAERQSIFFPLFVGRWRRFVHHNPRLPLGGAGTVHGRSGSVDAHVDSIWRHKAALSFCVFNKEKKRKNKSKAARQCTRCTDRIRRRDRASAS